MSKIVPAQNAVKILQKGLKSRAVAATFLLYRCGNIAQHLRGCLSQTQTLTLPCSRSKQTTQRLIAAEVLAVWTKVLSPGRSRRSKLKKYQVQALLSLTITSSCSFSKTKVYIKEDVFYSHYKLSPYRERLLTWHTVCLITAIPTPTIRRSLPQLSNQQNRTLGREWVQHLLARRYNCCHL